VTDDPTQVGEVDVVLLGVKAWQVTEATEALGPMIGPETMVVPLQNGVDPGEGTASHSHTRARLALAEASGNDTGKSGICGRAHENCASLRKLRPILRFPGRAARAQLRPLVL